jgi:hypothetical protein
VYDVNVNSGWGYAMNVREVVRRKFRKGINSKIKLLLSGLPIPAKSPAAAALLLHCYEYGLVN